MARHDVYLRHAFLYRRSCFSPVDLLAERDRHPRLLPLRVQQFEPVLSFASHIEGLQVRDDHGPDIFRSNGVVYCL